MKLNKMTKEKDKLILIKSEIEKDKDKFISDKLKELDDVIGRLLDTKPKKEGNITMRQYLINDKVKIQNNPDEFIEKRLKDLSDLIAQIDLEGVDGS